ncbi:hypothetical protein NKG94_47300 [Micromonospora sp. M12]
MTAFLDRIGYDAVDVGPLAEGWRYQPDTPAYGTLYSASPTDWQHPAPGDAESYAPPWPPPPADLRRRPPAITQSRSRAEGGPRPPVCREQNGTTAPRAGP